MERDSFILVTQASWMDSLLTAWWVVANDAFVVEQYGPSEKLQ